MSKQALTEYVKKTEAYLRAQVEGLGEGEDWETIHLEPLDELWKQMTPEEHTEASLQIEVLKERLL